MYVLINRAMHLKSCSDRPVQYIDAEIATIVTTNGYIDGKFHVSRSLELRTSNQPIDAEATLKHDAHVLGDTPTNLTLHTENAYVSLHSH